MKSKAKQVIDNLGRLSFMLRSMWNNPTSYLFIFSAISILAYIFLFNLFINLNLENITDVLLNIASITATIFTITISLTIIGFQFLSQNVSNKSLKYLFKSKFFILMVLSYFITILYNLVIVVGNLQLAYFLHTGIILFIFSMVYTISYFYWIVWILQEENILKVISRYFPEISLQDEKHEIIKEICLKSIRGNNLIVFSKSLKLLNQREQIFLNRIKNKKLSEDYDFDSRHSEIENIIHYFLNFQRQIFYELIEHKRQDFLPYYIEGIKEIKLIVFPLLAPRPYRDLGEHFNKIGESILEKRFDEIYLFYAHKLAEVVKNEYHKLPKETLEASFDFSKIKNEEESIKKERILWKILYDDFNYNRLKFLSNIAKKAIITNQETLNWFPKSILTDILLEAIKIKNCRIIQRELIVKIISLFKEIHKENINHKKVENYFGVLDLHYLIEEMNEEQIKEIGAFITREYCTAQLELFKIKPSQIVWALGVNGRFFKGDNKNLPLLQIIMDTFDAILKDFKKRKVKEITIDYLSNEIYSILGDNKENNRVVNKIIKKHKIMHSKNVYIAGAFMGTKKEWQKKNKISS